MLSHIIIEGITPMVDCGRHPAKCVVGEPCVVEADIFRDGHQLLRAAVKWRRQDEEVFSEAPMAAMDNDRWRGQFEPRENAPYVFTVEAWTDLYASWLADFAKKVDAGRDVASDLLEGIELLEAIRRRAKGDDLELVTVSLNTLRRTSVPQSALAIVSVPHLAEAAARHGERFGATQYEPLLHLTVDRTKGSFGSWYEMFVRSQTPTAGRHGTFSDAERRLTDIRGMGFDVVYLPPIHPIGQAHRKGPNNSLDGGRDAVGSPWAIGNSTGGHTAVEPQLGTLHDFDRFVGAAARLGIEVALDFAVQCSPDHPWVKEYPQWFKHRPDGTIKYAENPPKEYQDIYPIDFDTADQKGLMQALLDVVWFWIGHGVRIFRVDNPHTKPVAFWEWLIGEVQSKRPDVIFLGEAFTRPKMMKALGEAGFTQSYSYFTWRNSKYELTEYLTELTNTEMADYLRPNFFTNTPDILTAILQTGGRPAFTMRLVLAATLSPAYGIYSGFELCENQAVAPGSEEYVDSEKYQVKPRDWNAPGNIKEFVALVNAIRRDNAALHFFRNLRFLPADNDQILFYAKTAPGGRNVLLIPVNLDPFHPQECTVTVPPEVAGVAPGQRFRVTDLLTNASYDWSQYNYVRLDPAIAPAHILRVEGQI
jgi:starch synthase (maltosyl-transferring)